jgi:hypothetical protein
MGADQISFYTNLLSIAVVFVCWVIFGWMILFGRKPHASEDKTREPLSWVGLVLQLAGMGVTILPRWPIGSEFAGDRVVNIVLQIAAIVLAVGSVWLVISALRELGKQWSLEARVLEGIDLSRRAYTALYVTRSIRQCWGCC